MLMINGTYNKIKTDCGCWETNLISTVTEFYRQTGNSGFVSLKALFRRVGTGLRLVLGNNHIYHLVSYIDKKEDESETVCYSLLYQVSVYQTTNK